MSSILYFGLTMLNFDIVSLLVQSMCENYKKNCMYAYNLKLLYVKRTFVHILTKLFHLLRVYRYFQLKLFSDVFKNVILAANKLFWIIKSILLNQMNTGCFYNKICNKITWANKWRFEQEPSYCMLIFFIISSCIATKKATDPFLIHCVGGVQNNFDWCVYRGLYYV